MPRLLALLALLALTTLSTLSTLPSPTHAIDASKVGEADWHLQNIGHPTVPIMQNAMYPKALLTSTDAGVVASLNSRTGKVAWRSVLPSGASAFATGHSNIAATLDSDGTMLRVWDARNGKQSFALPLSGSAALLDMSVHARSAAAPLIILVDAASVTVVAPAASGSEPAISARRLSSPGKGKGKGKGKDKGQALARAVVACAVDADACLVVALSQHGALLAASFSPTSSKDNIKLALVEDFAPAGQPAAVSLTPARSGAAVLVSGDASVWGVSLSAKGAKGKGGKGSKGGKGKSKGSVKSGSLAVPGTVAHVAAVAGEGADAFLITTTQGASFLASPSRSGSQQAVVSLDTPAGTAGFGAVAFRGKTTVVAVVDAESSRSLVFLDGATGAQTGSPAQLPSAAAAAAVGPVSSVSLFAYPTKSGSVSHRVVLDTAGHSLISIKVPDSGSATVSWIRHESLAAVDAAAFCDLPPPPDLTTDMDHLHAALGIGASAASNPLSQAVARVSYQLNHAVAAALDFVSPDPAAHPDPHDASALGADLFGFNKAVVVSTRPGVVLGLTTSSSEVLWSLYAPTHEAGKAPVVVAHPGAATHALVIAGARVLHIDATSGAVVDTLDLSSPVSSVLTFPAQGGDAAVAAALRVPAESSLILLGHQTVHVVSTAGGSLSLNAAASGPAAAAALAPVVTQYEVDAASGVVSGSSLGSSGPSWSTRLPEGTRLAASAQAGASGRVASPALVLPGGDDVLYRYLNPHMAAFAALDDTLGALHILAVDTVSGNVVAHLNVPDAAAPVSVAIVDNALVYSYYNYRAIRFEVGVTDLFEPDFVDHGSHNATLDPGSLPAPVMFSQAFVTPGPVSALGATTTRLGIAAKQVLFYGPHRGVYAVPRVALDGRRNLPGAMAYHYNLDMPLTSLLSYTHQVEGITAVSTAPCALESHSLVFAYGDLDVFFTRVAPSGEFDALGHSFQYGGLILTLAVLLTLVFLLKGLVARKNLGEEWK